MKHVKRTPAVNKSKKPRGHKLSPRAWSIIRAEAKSLGMSDDEYVRLAGTLFATLRRALADQQSLDGKGLLQLVENPLFGTVIQYLAANAKQTAPGDPSNETNATQSTSPNPPHPTEQSPARPVARPPMQPAPFAAPDFAEWEYW